MEIDLKVEGKSVSWSIDGKAIEKKFDGNVFYADALELNKSKVFIIVARTGLTGKDSFYIVSGLGGIIEKISIPESFPEISSLYAVDKANNDYEIIVRSNESKFGRDLAFRFSTENNEFVAWREHW
jgi:hypothetical protein